MSIKFGPSGNSNSFYAEGHKHTVETPAWLFNRGLNCFEYSLGRGITIREETASLIGAEAEKYGVDISVHAPYFINFANPESYDKSLGYIMNSLRILKAFGGKRLIFHVGSAKKYGADEAWKNLLDALKRMTDEVRLAGEFEGISLCPETMGKRGQIGSVKEILDICKTDGIFVPCIDFGHVNARDGGVLRATTDYRGIISEYADALGSRALNMHIHFSRIEYSAAGEIRHLTFADDRFGPYFEDLMPVIKEYGMEPVIICESDGTQAEDAKSMMDCYYR